MLIPAGIHVQWVDEEAVVLNEKTGELHYLNPPSALIYALVLEFKLPKALQEAIARIDGPREEVESEAYRLIESFKEKGILSEGPPEFSR